MTMIRLLTSIPIAISLALFSSCGGEGQGKAPDAEGDAQPATQTIAGLRLDDGKKWKVNAATHVGMAKMQSLLTDFEASQAKDYKSLGEALVAEADAIVAACDMTGEPHEQLHVVLVPILEAIHGLADGRGGSDECQVLRQHLSAYHAHFER